MIPKDKVFIIAEAGVNHNGEVDMAMRLVDAAVSAGADAVKFQTFKAAKLVTKTVKKAGYQLENDIKGKTQFEMLKKLELSFDDFINIKKYCDTRKIQFLSTPFDEESVEFLVNRLGMDIIKVPSGEITNLQFIRYLAGFNRGLILSTGMCDLHEVQAAIDTIRKGSFGNELILLHCTTNYPCRYEDVNLRAMLTMRDVFDLPTGYSDHTLGIEIPIAAAALGASVVEKHFTLDRNMSGPDHRCSLQPEELKTMVNSIRNIERSLGDGVKKPTCAEIDIAKLARKTIVVNKSLEAGSIITRQDLGLKRSGGEIYPAEADRLIGKRLKNDKMENEALYWGDILEK